MAISVGDVYFIAYFGQGTASGDNVSSEGFAILVRNPIAAGEVLNFTDNGLQPGGAFQDPGHKAIEQTISFIVPAGGIAANCVLQFPLNGAKTTDVYRHTGNGSRVQIGMISPEGATGLSNAGDQLFAYQGTLDAPTVLAGIDVSTTSPIASGATSSQTTYPPPSGVPFLDFPTGTNNVQITIDPTTATTAQLIDVANYQQNIPNSTNPETSFSSINAACYCPGTLIATERGEVPIERLAIGDRVLTVHGEPKPIRWIGRRTYTGAQARGQRLVLPVCVRAGALGDGLPRRDLWVSPGHAMQIEDQLIHARLLVNGVSILQAEAVDVVTYLNVELDEHDIILAEGAPAESFFDNGDRKAFANAAEFHRLYPDDPGPGLPCLPLLEQGVQLDAIRRRLDARVGLVPPAPHAPGPLRGYVDVAGPTLVTGWAQDEHHPEEPVRLDVLVDGRRVMRLLANKDRADLHAAGLGSGRHAFEVTLPKGCRGVVAVHRTADGTALPLTGSARESLRDAA